MKKLNGRWLIFFSLVYFLTRLAQAQVAVSGEYIVKLKPQASGSIHSKVFGKAYLKAAFETPGAYHLQNVSDQVVQQLKTDPEVEYVEPNFVLQSIQPQIDKTDLTLQAAKFYDQTGSSVRATEAWGVSLPYSSGNRPIIAIIDTGVDKNHNVFSSTGALWINSGEIAGNGIDDDFNGYVDDVNGWNFITNNGNFADDQNHGTHVAGIVLGATQDILATTLEPAKVRLMPLKFLDSQGSGSTADAIKAIYYAVNMGAKVINCSWGGGNYSQSLLEAMTHAYERGVLIVTAAGNYSSNNDASPIYPANYDVPSNIAIAATNDVDQLAPFSNYGSQSVHLGAPGVYVFSTIRNGYFSSMSGTSMAAPFVAGTAALALREATQLSGYQLKQIALSSAKVVTALNSKVNSSSRINSEAMLRAAQGMISAQSFQPDYKPDYSRAPAGVSSSSSSGGGGGCGLVSSVIAKNLISGKGSGHGWPPGASGVLALLFGLPMVVWFALRQKTKLPYSRRYERYVMKSEIKIKSGDRELVGTLNTISMGGLSFNVDEALEKGGSICMKIKGPNGEEGVEVEGRIVWSEKNQAYGVQFDEVKSTVREMLFGWTKNLVRQGT